MANQFTLEGTSLDAQNNPVYVGRYMVLRITSVGTDTEDAASYPQDSVSFLIDSNGDWTSGATLWVNGDSGIESFYEMREPSGEPIQFIFPSAVAGTTVRYEFALENYLAENAAAQQSPALAAHIADLNNPHVVTPAQLSLVIGTDTQAHSTNLDSIDQDLGTTDDVDFNSITIPLIQSPDANGIEVRSITTGRIATFGAGASQETSLVRLVLDTDLAVAEGGTGASTASAARVNLDLEVGVDVQAYDATIVVDADIGSTVQAHDADLDTIAALSPSQYDVMESTGSVWALKDGQIATSLVVVRSASDLSGTLLSDKVYIIDGIIDMGSQSIEVPAGGLTIKGFSFDVSQLISTENSYTMFTSPVGGSGNLLGIDFAMDASGTSSQVFNLVGDTGNEAIEFIRVNWNNCTSLGTIDGYRQGLESGTGRFGGTPNLTLKNPWSGGYFIDTSIVRGLAAGMTGALYQAGTGFTMASRFRSNQNIDLPASAAFLDFAAANFTNPSTLQLDGCLVSRGGVIDASDSNLTPNIAASALECSWTGNTGLDNTFEGGELTISSETTTTISVSGTFVDMAGTYTASGLQHFDSPASGQLRHLGDSPVAYRVSGQIVLDSNSNDVVDLKIVIFRDATTSFEDAKTQSRVINNLQGARDVGYYVLLDNITLNKNDYVKLQVANIGTTNNITAELDSFFTVETR